MSKTRIIKILATGKSDFTYNRTQILFAGIEAHNQLELSYYPIVSRKHFNKKEFQQKADAVDFLFIPAFRHRDVSFIKKLSDTPLIFDPLISKYLTKKDYGQSWKAPLKFFLDKRPFKKADILIADTLAHKDYYCKTFGVQNDKVVLLPIGFDSELFYPINLKTNDKFCVGFYGNFNPLQAVDKIVKAAQILASHEDIYFKIVGGGFDFKKVEALVSELNLNNVYFVGKVPYAQLNEEINSFDVCLGVFGDSEKTDLVVPNKIFHYAGCRKAIITKRTKAIQEYFKEGKDIHLIENQPGNIANAIIKLKEEPILREQLANHIYENVLVNYDKDHISHVLYNELKNYL